MNSQYPYTVEDDEDGASRFPIPPGAIVLILGLLLLGAIVVGVIASRSSDGGGKPRTVTIADLLGNPDGWDNRRVEITGTAEGVRRLPYITQYAVYTFRDPTGTVLVLTQKGVPPTDPVREVRLTGLYHSKVTLDDELKRIVEDQFGSIAGAVVSALLPGVPINVVFIEQEKYALAE